MSDRISRGEIISLLAGIPVAALMTTGIASADDMATRKTYKYQDKPGKGGAKCAGCTLFKAPNKCSVVPGNIKPTGWCIAYSPKAH